MKGATNIDHPKDDLEYGRRNLLHCKAVGADRTARHTLERLLSQKRAPKWLIARLRCVTERTGPVATEMAAHRDEMW